MYNEHLVSTFCIPKPKTLSTASNQALSLTQKSSIQFDLRHTVQPNSRLQRWTEKKPYPSHLEIRRSYDMIAKQINCSAAVSINLKDKVQKRRKVQQKKKHNFIENFQEIYKQLVPHRQSEDNFLTLRKGRKKTTKFVRFITHSNLSDEEKSITEDTRNDLAENTQKQQKLGYYARLKRKLGMKIDDIVQNHPNNRLSNGVENKAENDQNISKALRLKADLKNNESFLRLSRTGMMIKLSDIQRKAKGTNLAMIQNQKARKDFVFQKCLAKNCQIVLEDITRYEKTSQSCLKTRQSISSSKPNSTVLRKTQSSQKRVHKEGDSISNLEILRWRERCLQIEVSCKKNYKSNKNIKRGMKIFNKYCGKLRQQLQCDAIALQAILKEERGARNMEEYQNVDAFSFLIN